MKTGMVFVMLCFLVIGCSKPYHSSIQTPSQNALNSLEPTSPSFHERSHYTLPPNQWKFSLAPTSLPSNTQTPAPAKIKKKDQSLPVQQNQNKKLTLAQLRSKYPLFFRLRGSNQTNKIALTFDDGPDHKYTPQILDILRKHHVKATFFLIGIRAQANPAMVKRIVKEGHAIGNHSYNHANPAKLTEAQFEKQIANTQVILSKLIGYEPKLIRTPYGAIQENQLRWAAKNGFVVVNWDIDSLDWKELNSTQVLANVLGNIHRGSIILQHSAGGVNQDLSGTVQALPIIIEKLKKQGFDLVTVPELLHLPLAK
jgi:polysaccharide deacetylase family sporulation protein PdaB